MDIQVFKKEISLIVSDIEGCLSPGKNLPLDLFSLAQIQSCNSKARKNHSILLTLCTGRSQPFVEAFCQMLSVYSPCVCENGAFLYNMYSDTLLRHPLITDNHIRSLKELRQYLETEVRPKYPHRQEPGKEICISLNPIGSVDTYSERIEELYEQICPHIDQGMFNINHSASAVDITPCGIDKAAGVTFLSETMRIPTHQILGIGDTAGDLSFLKIVGLAAGPANMTEALKGVVHYTSQESEVRGVLDIISWLSR